MTFAWESLDDQSQLALSRAALERAIGIVARHAETLANEIESGSIVDRGGVEALRLFACVTRTACPGGETDIALGRRGHA